MNLFDDYQSDYEEVDGSWIADREETIYWAKKRLAEDCLILDTETTGLKQTDEIIQLGVIDLQANTLIDTYIQPTPTCPISPEASAIHGITLDMLKDAPTFPEIYPEIKSIIENRNLLIYNSDFDVNKLTRQTFLHNLPLIDYTPFCVMSAYAEFAGNWSDYHQSYTWQPLPGGDHTAIGDALATLAVLKEMANAELWT